MRSLQRRTGAACILAALCLVLLSLPANAQGTVEIIDSGSSDELVAPPSPECNDLVFLTEVTFSAAGVPLDIPRFGVGPGLVTSFVVSDFPAVGPGVVILNEVITFDGHTGRDVWPAQPNERVKFEFLLDGVTQAVTPFTPDVPDGVLSAWLDMDMGRYELPNGADELRIVHFGDPNNTDSVIVSALCGRHEPYRDDPDATTTVVPTTAVATTVPATVVPTTAVPTTVPATVVPTTAVATTVPATVVPTTAVATTVPATVVPTTAVATTVPAVTSTTAAPTTTVDPNNTSTTADPATTTTVDPNNTSTTADPATTTTVDPNNTSTTADPATTTTEVTTEVRGAVEENANQLAATGADDLAMTLIAAGLIVLGCALILQSKDPEEMFSV